MRKRSSRLWDSCTRQLGLETKAQKRWFIAAFILLYIYLWLCLYLRNFLTSVNTAGVICTILTPAIQAIPLCIFGVIFFGRIQIKSVSPGDGALWYRRFFPVIAALITFVYLLLWLIAYFPGGFSPDSVSQYQQVLAGQYNNWHPVMHTWVFFWIPWQIFHHPAGIIFFQILLFSLAVGYLYLVLCRRGCPMPFLFGSWLFLILNLQTARIMMFPWKDSALTIVSLVIFTQVIEIFESDGAWLKKWDHFLAFTVFCFLSTVFRHNAVLLTAPLYLLLFFFHKDARRSLLLSGALVLFSVWFLNGPVMTLAHVEAPGDRQVEILGLPMTVLSEVFISTPEKLPAKAVDFISCLATPEEWDKYYRLGDFNYIKFNSSLPLNDLIEHEGARAILRYTEQAFLASPLPAFRALAALTQLVWDPLACSTTISVPYCPAVITDSIGTAVKDNAQLIKVLTYFSDSVESFYLYLLTWNIGTMILIAMFAAVANVGRGKLGRAFMIFPMLIYDFGTMLLLTGGDFRFFHFNFVIIIPLLYLILSGSKNHETVS